MKDLMGKALQDYINGDYTEDMLTETNISDPDEFPVAYLLRTYEEMPVTEQRALQCCKGKVLDAGSGAGSHALYLQQQENLEVTALDSSASCIEIARNRGVKHAIHGSLYDLPPQRYDTVLLLMNGTGLLGRFDEAAGNLKKIAELLTPNGQILIDSSDIIYMYDEDEDGGKWVPGDRYYGELDFTVHYRGESESFPWLYLDYTRLEEIATEAGLNCELITEGEHYDYLARLTFSE
ncbi:class I SAM-dependent methyltransferase [Robertkochia flava]|uniref:class I SAM-dependent methyltransferase n=1 Tax=Robertkochia flava TaxID=3447986 RepID=UPI001CCB311B|nr:class I SAM-dependent methyltransferase [Robertkochia marina]